MSSDRREDRLPSSDRMVAFTDAAVAIALTLLVLPLVDIVPEAYRSGEPAIEVVTNNLAPIGSFLLSFVVIARFWSSHHRLYGYDHRLTRALVQLNLLWVLTIAVLPFPTEMVATFPVRVFVVPFYLGVLLVCSASLSADDDPHAAHRGAGRERRRPARGLRHRLARVHDDDRPRPRGGAGVPVDRPLGVLHPASRTRCSSPSSGACGATARSTRSGRDRRGLSPTRPRRAAPAAARVAARVAGWGGAWLCPIQSRAAGRPRPDRPDVHPGPRCRSIDPPSRPDTEVPARACPDWTRRNSAASPTGPRTGRAGMEAFYALATEDYRQMVAARDWAADLRGHADDGRVRVLDVACGSGKFPAELIRRGLAEAVGETRVEIDLLDPSPFSIAEARSVLAAPFTVAAEHEVRIQDLAADVGGFDVAWATHALYAVPPDEIGAGIARMVAAQRPGGFGAIVHADVRVALSALRRGLPHHVRPRQHPLHHGRAGPPALVAAGVMPTVTTLRYDVGHPDRAVVEGFLQRCVFDDSVPLDRMEDEGAVGAYLSGCIDDDGLPLHPGRRRDHVGDRRVNRHLSAATAVGEHDDVAPGVGRRQRAVVGLVHVARRERRHDDAGRRPGDRPGPAARRRRRRRRARGPLRAPDGRGRGVRGRRVRRPSPRHLPGRRAGAASPPDGTCSRTPGPGRACAPAR